MPLGNIFGLQFIVSQTSSNLFDQACLLDENGNPVLDENGNCILMENGTGALAAPVIDGVPTLGGFEEIGSTLTATAAGVTGEPVPTRTWQWQRSLDGSTSWTPINVRENLLLQSNQFDTTWGGNASVTSGQSGYDGSTDAWLLEKDNTGSFKSISQNLSVSGVWTFSLYAKANTLDSLTLRNQTNGHSATFDLDPNTIGNRISTNQTIDSSIVSVGNNWYKCTATFSGSSSQVAIYVGYANSNAGSIYIQDAQLEQGSSATEYIESGATTGLSSYTTSTDYTIQDSDDGYYLRVSQVETNTEGTDTAESIPTAFIATQETLAITNFTSRVEADGGTVESESCLESDLTFLMNNPQPSAFTGLLDTYSGAAAAYSLRLLDSTYSGNAIKVRRASDNTEQDIGFVNNVLDTATLESFCSGTDGFVTNWYDQSGNANNIVLSTAAYQPKIVSSGSTITDGGKASITIDELVNRGLEIPIAASSTQDFFQVHKTNDTNFILFRDSFSINRLAWATTDGNSSTVLNSNYGTPSLFVNGTSQNPQNRDALHSLLSTNNQVLMSSIGGDSSAFTGNIKWSHYSSSSIYDGNVQEIIFYNSDQSSNRSGIETNINDYYSIY